MVSWKAWIYVPVVLLLFLGVHTKTHVLIYPMLIILGYGIIKIFTRSCMRKYVTSVAALFLLFIIVLQIQNPTLLSAGMILVLLDVI